MEWKGQVLYVVLLSKQSKSKNKLLDDLRKQSDHCNGKGYVNLALIYFHKGLSIVKEIKYIC